MRRVVSRAESPQNVRVAARSRIFSARAQKPSSTPEDWLPSALQASADIRVEQADAVPADPAAAAELGSEVQRLRRQLGEANERAERAEAEAAELRERAEAMKRAAAQAAAASHPDA
jgi:molecular chaperone GrpE (heat shock protein)